MFLSISTTHSPASDLGFLLHKHPARMQSFDVSVGTAHVFYPEATDGRCTAALLLEVDPIALVRGRKGPTSEGFALGQYVNDRPYSASSMMSMALSKAFRTAMAGRCDSRPELAAAAIALDIHVPALPCRGGGSELARRVFEPLGWTVHASTSALDPQFPAWGDSHYVDLRLSGVARLSDALNHLYVLLPVLDDAKHYWVSPDEVDKLVRAGDGWLATHPDKELITRRYLAHQRVLANDALARLAEVDETDSEQIDAAGSASIDAGPEQTVSLAEQRRSAVLAAVRASGARTVGDLGCGEGALVAELLAERSIARVVAVDVSGRTLDVAGRRLRLDRMPELQRARLDIFQSSLTYRDDRLFGLDAAVLMEVIEHVDLPRLGALERAVFDHAAPDTVIVTTPNVEYNVRFEGLSDGLTRHRDHRFEWTRAEFRDWADRVAASYGYDVEYLPIGLDDAEVGPASQMAVFTKKTTGAGRAA